MAQNVFNTIMGIKPKRNHFDMSHDRKFSCNMGQLVPIHVQEVIPGDKINMKSTQMIRFAPLVSPMMHKVDVYTHFFFVPNRLLWSNWEQFITGGQPDPITGVTPPSPIFPTITTVPSNVGIGEIIDYLGVPAGGTTGEPITFSALPIAAYGKIYDEFYRDQNLQEPINWVLNDGDNSIFFGDSVLDGFPLPRAWEHDYFTSSLPFAQKGSEVVLPLGDTAPIRWEFNTIDKLHSVTGGGAEIDWLTPTNIQATPGTGTQFATGNDLTNTGYISTDNSDNLSADLSQATSSSINDLRRAFRLQEWLEKNARGGSRYIETILSHFGVRSSDARLQRPEYLGGGKSTVSVSEVLQTSGTAPDGGYTETPQGTMAGHGINVGQSNNFSRYFEEHGFIIGIMSVMPKPTYQQGLHRSWTKFNKLDYYWPSFAHIGEQEVKNKEIFCEGTIDEQEGTFGYVPRYSEYRYMPSTVHGDFRDTLSYWHMGRIFDNMPALNADFIECNLDSPIMNRVFAVPDPAVHKLYCQVFHEIHAIRPIPKFGVPTF